MVTGSIVSSLQGEPRATHDIDFVISIRKYHIEKLANKFQTPDYYLDKDEIIDALIASFETRQRTNYQYI